MSAKFGGCIRDRLYRRPRLGEVSLGHSLKAGLTAGQPKGVERPLGGDLEGRMSVPCIGTI